MLELEAASCLREADRPRRGGGGISVFFGDKGRPFCLASSCLTGDDGLGAIGVLRDAVEVIVGFRGTDGFRGLGLIRLWRRVMPVASCVDWFCSGCCPFSAGLLALWEIRLSDCCCSRGDLVARPSSRIGRRLLDRVTTFSLPVAVVEAVPVAAVEVVGAGLPAVARPGVEDLDNRRQHC